MDNISYFWRVITDDKRMTIREWAQDDRPREKLMMKGPQSLSDAELLAILISSGNQNETAVELSRRILRQCGDNFHELARLSVNDLCKSFKGIGPAKAITIIAALELGKRRKIEESMARKQISSSAHLYELFEPYLSDLNHEEFWVALLNGANKLITVKRLTQGGSRQTVVDLPMLLKIALDNLASNIAVAHNHPSGQDKPSHEDETITKRIKAGCEAIGITMLDHIIITQNKYYSFSDEGKM